MACPLGCRRRYSDQRRAFSRESARLIGFLKRDRYLYFFLEQVHTKTKIYKKYKQHDFIVLAFPSNDFRQELSTDEEIKDFCEAYELSFPIFAKGKVKGFEKQEVFKYLTEESNGKSKGEIRWNFEKFLVSREGKLVKRFRSSVDPNQDEISEAIESLL